MKVDPCELVDVSLAKDGVSVDLVVSLPAGMSPNSFPEGTVSSGPPVYSGLSWYSVSDVLVWS